MDWQPIDTYPAAEDSSGPSKLFCVLGGTITQGYGITFLKYDDTWQVIFRDCYEKAIQPTHWAHLPKSPFADGRGG